MKKLLVLASVGEPNVVTKEGPMQLGIVEVPDDVVIDLHSPVRLPGELHQAAQALLVAAKEQLGAETTGKLSERAYNSGLSAVELYETLGCTHTPARYLEVLAKYLEVYPRGTAENAIMWMEARRAERPESIQPGTIQKAKAILSYVTGGNAGDYKKLVGKDMPERFTGNRATGAEVKEMIGDLEARGKAAAKPQKQGHTIPAMREVNPLGSPDSIGPKPTQQPQDEGQDAGTRHKTPALAGGGSRK